MKNKFLLSAMFLLLLVGLYSPASYSQTFNLWGANDNFVVGATSYSFDVYIQRTGSTPLTVYSFQLGLTYTVAAINGGTLTAVWSNVDPSLTAKGQTPKAPGLATDRKSTRLNSSHLGISYAVFCLKKKKNSN